MNYSDSENKRVVLLMLYVDCLPCGMLSQHKPFLCMMINVRIGKEIVIHICFFQDFAEVDNIQVWLQPAPYRRAVWAD